MIFRDDDINKLTDLNNFKRVHNIFKKRGILHTLAITANDIEEHEELVDYIKQEARMGSIDLQLHCFDHLKMTNDYELCEKDLTLGIETMQRVFGIRPSVFYPPWNDSDSQVEKIAKTLLLETSAKKISLSAYVQSNGITAHKVINFHHWAPECMLLEAAILLYKKRNQQT